MTAALPLFLLAVIPVTAADLRDRRIPNAAVVLGLALAFWWAWQRGDAQLWDSLLGGALAFTLFWCVWYFSRGRLGLGDVKFAPVVGAFCGAAGFFAATFVAAALGLVLALALMAVDRANARVKIPFAPFLSAGGVAALLAQLTHWPAFLFGGTA